MIRNLIDRFFSNGNSVEHTITILGLPNSGKTTLLYLLKTGEILNTVPTFGIQVEIVNVKTESGKSFKMTGWEFGRGPPYGSSVRDVRLRSYTFATEAIIWVVDASDRNSLAESVETLGNIISEVYQDRIDTIPILIFANKSDKPEAMSLNEILISFSKVVSGRITSIFRTAMAANTKPDELNWQATGLPKAFDWLLLALDVAKNAKKARPPTHKAVTIRNESGARSAHS